MSTNSVVELNKFPMKPGMPLNISSIKITASALLVMSIFSK